MRKKTAFRIDDPCSQDWDTMTPQGANRFCGSCNKTVIDFTNLSDAAIIRYFSDKSEGSVCCRFAEDQLNRPMSFPKRTSAWIRHLVHVLLPAMLIGIKATAQERRTLGTPIYVKPDTRQDETRKAVLRITSADGSTVPNASVTIVNTEEVIVADSFGVVFFSPKSDLSELNVSSAGFVSRTIIYEKSSEAQTVVLQPAVVDLAPVVVSSQYIRCTRRIFTGGISVGKVVKSQEVSELRALLTGSGLRLYPNPAHANQDITVSFNAVTKDELTLTIFNAAGQSVLTKGVAVGLQTFTLRLPDLSAGNYFLVAGNLRSQFVVVR